jgi:hypothetical protein
VQPAAASARCANPPASTWLVACCFPLSRSSCKPTPSTLTAANLCWPRYPSVLGQKANRGQDHQLGTGRGSVFVATKLAHRSLSRNPASLVGNSEQRLAIRQLISTIVLERAAPVGFAGRVARREFGVNSRPGGKAADSAAFQCVENLWVWFCHTVEKPRGWRVERLDGMRVVPENAEVAASREGEAGSIERSR